jgi:hypothetical protein
MFKENKLTNWVMMEREKKREKLPEGRKML